MLEQVYYYINKIMHSGAREEAKNIAQLSSPELQQEMIDHANDGNIFCLVFDKAKAILINEGKMARTEEDSENPFL